MVRLNAGYFLRGCCSRSLAPVITIALATTAIAQLSPILPIAPVPIGTPGVYTPGQPGQSCEQMTARCPGLVDAHAGCVTDQSSCTYCAVPLYQTHCVKVDQMFAHCASEATGHPSTGDCGAVMVGACNGTSCIGGTPTGMNCGRIWCRSGR